MFFSISTDSRLGQSVPAINNKYLASNFNPHFFFCYSLQKCFKLEYIRNTAGSGDRAVGSTPCRPPRMHWKRARGRVFVLGQSYRQPLPLAAACSLARPPQSRPTITAPGVQPLSVSARRPRARPGMSARSRCVSWRALFCR